MQAFYKMIRIFVELAKKKAINHTIFSKHCTKLQLFFWIPALPEGATNTGLFFHQCACNTFFSGLNHYFFLCSKSMGFSSKIKRKNWERFFVIYNELASISKLCWTGSTNKAGVNEAACRQADSYLASWHKTNYEFNCTKNLRDWF